VSNPFFYGNPIPPDQFLDRQRELNRAVARIVNRGQSTAIVGEPRSGKTSLLEYLSASEKQAELFENVGVRLVFSYLDAETFTGEFSQAQFWEHALFPLCEAITTFSPELSLAKAYEVCQENGFGAFVLERLFAQMVLTGWRLVLRLDEFDSLLYHPVLNCAEFFGSLRSLASRSRGALALVIASRRALTDLNKDTQRFSRTSSPYFNIFSEVVLRPLPNKYIAELLRRGEGRFTANDRRFIVRVAGGHPYLLQVGASALWEAYAEGQVNRERRWQQVGQDLYGEVALTLENTWGIWPPAMRKAFTSVAMVDIPKMLGQHEFYVLPLLRDLCDFGPELRSLEKQGFVEEDESAPGGWRVRPQAFLWWLADEIVRTARDDDSFEDWLRKQELGFLLTRAEKEMLSESVRAVLGLLKKGAETLIEATVKGFVAGTVNAV